MTEKSFGRSFILLLLAFLVLLVYQVLYDYYPVFGDKYRNFTFFNGWSASEPADTMKISPESVPVSAVCDSLTLKALSDSVTSALQVADSASAPAPAVITTGLDHFSQALHELAAGKRKKVRIAWFGDSMIEGDLIVMTFRNAMQKEFGGEGVGMLPMTSPVAGFRITVKQTFSNNWKEWNVVEQKPLRFPPGLFCSVYSGKVRDPEEQFWVKYKGTGTFTNTLTFHNATLFYGTPRMLKDTLSKDTVSGLPVIDVFNGDRLIGSMPLDTNGYLHKLELFSSPLQEFTIYCRSDSAVPYYGVSIESDSGIFIDNFASRGNSGIGLWQISDNLLRQFQDLLQYDLVILQFGTNAMSPGMTDYNWYGHSMNKVLAKLRQGFTGSSFLLVSVADRAMKGENGMQTDPGVPEMVKVQRRIALSNDMDFLDLYSAMGGEGTIVRWTDQEEPLANKDYTHVNFKGARKISDIIFSHVMKAYRSTVIKADTVAADTVKPVNDSVR